MTSDYLVKWTKKEIKQLSHWDNTSTCLEYSRLERRLIYVKEHF